jgi:hypothetical protein
LEDCNVDTEAKCFRGKKREKIFGVVIKREKDVFDWVWCLLTRQAKLPQAQGTCKAFTSHTKKVFCNLSFENVLKTLARLGGDPPSPPEKNSARTILHRLLVDCNKYENAAHCSACLTQYSAKSF